MIDYKSALEKVFALHTFGIKLGLDNTIQFLNYLGNPQNSLSSYHIAGSNGKGSTAAFISSILQECGYTTGLYTSPHFVKFNERIKINGIQIDDDTIAEFVNTHEKIIDELKLTFFEVTTALAFKYFADCNVDFAVIETGLGGRLDATNVLNPVACVITSISLEHTNILGTTIPEIAFEKSEIIKPGAKVFIGRIPVDAEKKVEDKCKSTNCQLYKIEDYIQEKGDLVELYTEEIELIDWSIPLRGSYQKYNAALAGLVITKTLGLDDESLIKNGVSEVILNTGIQGRYEYMHTSPAVILDSAHNTEGIKAFVSEFKKESHKYDRKVLLFGAMKDKSISEMLEILFPEFDEIILTKINYERSADLAQLTEIADNLGKKVSTCDNAAESVMKFMSGQENDCLVVLGSMYLIGEIKAVLCK